jgi:putative NADH-flavin reductase
MKTVVVGANGATGRQLVKHLLNSGHEVKAVIRPSGEIPDDWLNNGKLTLIRGNITEMSVDEMATHLAGCEAIASCLGHNLTLKGIFGKPRKLVTISVKLLCHAVQQNSPKKPVLQPDGNRTL